MNLDLLKELYYFELQRKQQLEASLMLPVALLTGLGGVLFSFARSFTYGGNAKTYVFATALSGATISLMWVVFYLIRATHPFTYEVIPSSTELLSFYDQSKDYYRSIAAEFKADEDFESEMRGAYAKASSKNRQNNISKSGFLYRAQMGLVCGAVFLAIGVIPYLADELVKPIPVQKVEIVNARDAK